MGGEFRAFRDGDGIQYLFSDHIGSASVSYRPSDSRTQRQYYMPYGGIRHTDGLDTDIGYTGQRADTSTGLMFYNARYYDPAIGRFISPDTIVPDPANPQDYDRYAYVRNNPVNYSDPTGHCPSELQNVSVLCAEHDTEVLRSGLSHVGREFDALNPPPRVPWESVSGQMVVTGCGLMCLSAGFGIHDGEAYRGFGISCCGAGVSGSVSAAKPETGKSGGGLVEACLAAFCGAFIHDELNEEQDLGLGASDGRDLFKLGRRSGGISIRGGPWVFWWDHWDVQGG